MKTAKQLGLTPTQHKNLAKLTVFTHNKVEPPRFNINSFFNPGNNRCKHIAFNICPSIKDYECGTTACFLGYGIPAGIKAHKHEMWEKYSARAFGINIKNVNNDVDAYNFLFAEDHKNSKDAAVLRGAWFLMHGLPDDAQVPDDAEDDAEAEGLCYWEAPSDFKPDWAAIEAIANQ